MVNIIQVVLLLAAGVGPGFSVLSVIMLGQAKREHHLRNRAPRFQPPVSVFKPLKGLDEDLDRNLASFFRIDYPNYELIFGVNDFGDPAIEVVRRLQVAYPNITSRLVVDDSRAGHNPKVNNLCNMVKAARFNHWVVSDSNVRVPADYLTDLVGHMQSSEIGLVTSLIRGVGGRSLGARLENLHLNTFIAGATIVVNGLTSIPISIGKSMLLRRDIMRQLGGFEAFADYLLEDALIGQRIRRLGYTTRTTFLAVDNVNTDSSLRSFVSRHFRWAVGRRRLNLPHYSTELLNNSACLAVVAVALAPSRSVLALAAGIVVLKTLFDLRSVRLLGGSVRLKSVWHLPFKDLVIGLIWWAPFFTDRVNWRGNRIRVGAMSKATLLRNRHNPAPSPVWSRPLAIVLSTGWPYTVARSIGRIVTLRSLRRPATIGENPLA